MGISRENSKTWHNEKRVKELSRRGYDVESIHVMMTGNSKDFTVSQIEKMVRHPVSPKEMPLDGKL
jgi:hypothetical protein